MTTTTKYVYGARWLLAVVWRSGSALASINEVNYVGSG